MTEIEFVEPPPDKPNIYKLKPKKTIVLPYLKHPSYEERFENLRRNRRYGVVHGPTYSNTQNRNTYSSISTRYNGRIPPCPPNPSYAQELFYNTRFNDTSIQNNGAIKTNNGVNIEFSENNNNAFFATSLPNHTNNNDIIELSIVIVFIIIIIFGSLLTFL